MSLGNGSTGEDAARRCQPPAPISPAAGPSHGAFSVTRALGLPTRPLHRLWTAAAREAHKGWPKRPGLVEPGEIDPGAVHLPGVYVEVSRLGQRRGRPGRCLSPRGGVRGGVNLVLGLIIVAAEVAVQH